MTEVEAKAHLKELSDLRQAAEDAIKKYNETARKNNEFGRLGLASTSVYPQDSSEYQEELEKFAESLGKESDDLSKEEEKAFEDKFFAEFDVDEWVSNRDYTSGSIYAPGTTGYWFPSSLC
jgi:hypothetical protein